VSAFSDAMKALRSLMLIEANVARQEARLESVMNQIIALDKRLVRVETILALSMRDGLPKIEGPSG